MIDQRDLALNRRSYSRTDLDAISDTRFGASVAAAREEVAGSFAARGIAVLDYSPQKRLDRLY